MSSNRKKLILIGASGHARVLLALIEDLGLDLAGVCDPKLAGEKARSWYGIPVLGGDEALENLDPEKYALANGIGPMVGRALRQTLYEKLRGRFAFPPLIHRTAWVAKDVALADGVQIMAGAILQPGCSIGANTTVNTRASVDHDTKIGANCHIAPGSVICGGVKTADNVYIGAGSTVIQNISIKEGSIIGAGAACVRDVGPNEILYGPSVLRKKRELTQ